MFLLVSCIYVYLCIHVRSVWSDKKIVAMSSRIMGISGKADILTNLDKNNYKCKINKYYNNYKHFQLNTIPLVHPPGICVDVGSRII